jgi:glycosyltransferase involved in cell wall biosynthesis
VKPLVSIIIPVYNAEKYLAASIESAIGQTWTNKELIIVDDGSTDGSLQIAQKYAGNPAVKVISQKNKGAAAARNAGLKAAKGDYIQFLDADDLLSPDKIESQIACLNGSATTLAICKTAYFNDGDDYLDGAHFDDWFCADSSNPVDFLTKLYAGKETMPGYGGMITIHAWLSPRNIIEKAGPWNETLSIDDDGEFFCRVVLASEGIKFSSTGLSYYRKYKNVSSLSAQKSLASYEKLLSSINLKYSHLKEKTSDPALQKIFARHYWEAGVAAYPKYKSLSDGLIKKAKAFGYCGPEYVAGPVTMALSRFFGWRFARIISYLKHGY